MAKKNMEYVPEKNSGAKKSSFIAKAAKAAVIVAALNLAAGFYVDHRKKKNEKKEEENKNSAYKNYEIFMSGRNIRIEDEKFAGASIKTCMGGVSLDLTRAQFDTDISIHIQNVFGGIDIKVPAGVNVCCAGKYVFSGVYNAVSDYEGEEVHTIYIEAKQVFGGLSIRAEQKNDDIIGDYFEESTFQNISKEDL